MEIAASGSRGSPVRGRTAAAELVVTRDQSPP
jgi:hypothetical protein